MHLASAYTCLFAWHRMSCEVSSVRVNTNESSHRRRCPMDRQVTAQKPALFPQLFLDRRRRGRIELKRIFDEWLECGTCLRAVSWQNFVSVRRGIFNERSVRRFYSFSKRRCGRREFEKRRRPMDDDGPREVWKWRHTFCGTYVS